MQIGMDKRRRFLVIVACWMIFGCPGWICTFIQYHSWNWSVVKFPSWKKNCWNNNIAWTAIRNASWNWLYLTHTHTHEEICHCPNIHPKGGISSRCCTAAVPMQLELMMARTKGVSNRSEVFSSCRWVPTMDSPRHLSCRFLISITEIYRNEFQWEILLPRHGSELAICVIRHDLKHIGQSLWIGFNCPLNCAGYSQRCKSNMGSHLTAREPRSTSANQQLCRAQPPELFRISGVFCAFLTCEDRYNWKSVWKCLTCKPERIS